MPKDSFKGCIAVVILVLASVGSHASQDAFTDREIRKLRSLSLEALGPPPDSPSNAVADVGTARTLGERLFFDPSLSGNGELSCASCHQPDLAFTDGEKLAEGVSTTGRNTPTLIGAAYQEWFYWDGRRDSLWSQALIPFEAPSEMGASRVSVVRRVLGNPEYRRLYIELFGQPPAIAMANLPAEASPLGGSELQNNWYRIDNRTQKAINRVYANIGKAIAAYERTLVPEKTAFDEFVARLEQGDGVGDPLEGVSAQQVQGMKLFIDEERTQCLMCHNGPLLTNGGFHNIGTGVFSGPAMDFGRSLGLRAVLLDDFNCLGDYSDARAEECVALNHLNRSSHQMLNGAFKTPTLRNLELTAPYFHDGRFPTLEGVIDFYREPPEEGPNALHELTPLDISDQEADALIEFLRMF